MKQQSVMLALLLITFCCSPLLAQQYSKSFDTHTIHFNAFPSDALSAEMTMKYGLKRSKNIAVVNISVIKNAASISFQGVQSKVTGVMKNLMSQEKTLTFKEIHEGNAYYYIAEVAIDNKDLVNFFIDVITSDNHSYTIKFSKQFIN
jgi:hypothetical protein